MRTKSFVVKYCRVCKTKDVSIKWKENRLCRQCANEQQNKKRQMVRDRKPRFTLTNDWKEIPGFSKYYISTKGDIVSCRQRVNGLLLKQLTDERGYKRCPLMHDSGKVITHNVNRLMCMAWYGVRSHDYDADHLNKIRDDNRLENLRWLLVKENRK